MRINFKNMWQKLVELLRLAPVSLAAKCRITFGAAVILVLALGLSIPYVWMNQLAKKAFLDAGRAKAETLMRRHFQLKRPGEATLAVLNNKGGVTDANHQEMRWIRFVKENEKQLEQVNGNQKAMIESLKTEDGLADNIIFEKKKNSLQSTYIRVFKATDNCITCHNAQGTAGAFNAKEPIGAVIISRSAGELSKMVNLNLVWILVAGLIAGTGAIITFYVITQRVILSPIRQLRALANNVAEGNLDTRSAIKTGDEFEKLADAFNHMLDTVQGTQQKLREANKQLDEKIITLSERNVELFKANKVKNEFLANMSHEFRTPLNAILGFADILREKPELIKRDKGRRYAENIIIGGKNLLNLINDLLDMAKTEAGKMSLHMQETSIPQLCRQVQLSFSSLTKKKNIRVKLVAEETIPQLVTDAGKVQQILYNFLSNSVKFTPELGRIEIKAAMVDEKTVRMSVTDSGCGIAEEDKEKIFEKFRQVDGSITRSTTGSGLGLAISRELATMLAGDIGMESEVGKGSTFWLDIPVILARQEQAVS